MSTHNHQDPAAAAAAQEIPRAVLVARTASILSQSPGAAGASEEALKHRARMWVAVSIVAYVRARGGAPKR